MSIHNLNGVKFKLKEPHNFGWLHELGEVFAVFDQQDSGNISFGIRNENEKLFVKYAGAKPTEYNGEPEEAIDRLKQSISVYKDLEHIHLVKLIDHFEPPEGFAAIFKWFEGKNLHPHWSFPPPAKYTDPRSPYFRFKRLPMEERLKLIDAIFSFHQFVAKMNYVAIDFYDGSLLYDFASKTTKICDIDVYQKRPFYNEMGRLWGSSRFMSPEEFTLGAEIDEITNVYNMGAMAFSLLGGEVDRSLVRWEAGIELYKVASRAAEQDRGKRFPSMDELIEAWRFAQRKEYFESNS
jgi:serine/threonine-protein kinase